ncbi:single-stranded DNA-binding protein [Clostridium botulinum]|uniref:Single-stranded DNA-binding protein n=2 Tax=Clostridium botulinum TaxID=1491 RepID=A0A846K0U1_CLOBO|nr:single-stranded DNA-binding protein [Clostridium botulinum]KAI3346279.1 single-stranded DNA-binding protein [Clostridium botulinum]KOM88886.1 single-stranded DNA-binding protein [Clostridium botulinum]KOR57723.1 single-stranded DNA-binding protein [Clostridium botulinum]NFE13315.1 single-stranded DNA-binding protein [Clostridium botulinum]NFE82857.1 single-stranded DNA-binding protein [Clostridium botulinum]
MNKLIITGNLVRDIDLKFTEGTGTAVLKNTVAAKRRFKDKNTQKYESDFIPIIAFGKTAEFIAEHFSKGIGIQIEAHMQSGKYDKNGTTVYTLEAVVENVEFMSGSKNNNLSSSNPFDEMSFEEDITPVDDGDMPF